MFNMSFNKGDNKFLKYSFLVVGFVFIILAIIMFKTLIKQTPIEGVVTNCVYSETNDEYIVTIYYTVDNSSYSSVFGSKSEYDVGEIVEICLDDEDPALIYLKKSSIVPIFYIAIGVVILGFVTFSFFRVKQGSSIERRGEHIDSFDEIESRNDYIENVEYKTLVFYSVKGLSNKSFILTDGENVLCVCDKVSKGFKPKTYRVSDKVNGLYRDVIFSNTMLITQESNVGFKHEIKKKCKMKIDGEFFLDYFKKKGYELDIESFYSYGPCYISKDGSKIGQIYNNITSLAIELDSEDYFDIAVICICLFYQRG